MKFFYTHKNTKPPIRRIVMMGHWLDLTWWYDGAISFQFRGHFLQIILGDWWEAMPKDDR